jgi:pimeloyl-ACP methyl ester carboxylesterase
MNPTQFARSDDGTRIAFDVSGEGPALILLHGGFVQTRRAWHDAGHVERLAPEFRVITVDLRGHGDSDAPTAADSYAIDRIVGDVVAVAELSRADRFSIWGYSLGGTIALHVASRLNTVRRAIVAGSYFGPIFSKEQMEASIARLELARAAKAEGRLAEFGLSDSDRQFLERANIDVMIGWSGAMAAWPGVAPVELRSRTLVYAGTSNEQTAARLRADSEAISLAGVELEFFEGLDHAREFSELSTILPRVLAFLR